MDLVGYTGGEESGLSGGPQTKFVSEPPSKGYVTLLSRARLFSNSKGKVKVNVDYYV